MQPSRKKHAPGKARIPEEVRMLHATVEQYCHALKAEGVYSKMTVLNYTCSVRRLKRAFGPNDSLEALTPAAMRKWFTEYRATHSAITARQTLTCLHQFFKWCIKEGYLLSDPSAGIPLPKRPAPHHDKFSDAQVKALLYACDKLADPFRCIRAKAVYSVLSFAGLRRMEVINLRIEDIDLTDRRIEVREGKGGKNRTLYIPAECVQALRDWMKLRPRTALHRFVFCANNTRRMYLGTLRSLLKEIHAIAEVPMPLRPCHTARHSLAQRLREKRVRLENIRDVLGHESIETTQIYLGETTQDQMRKVGDLASFNSRELPPNVSLQMQRQMERKRRRIGL